MESSKVYNIKFKQSEINSVVRSSVLKIGDRFIFDGKEYFCGKASFCPESPYKDFRIGINVNDNTDIINIENKNVSFQQPKTVKIRDLKVGDFFEYDGRVYISIKNGAAGTAHISYPIIGYESKNSVTFINDLEVVKLEIF